MLFSDYTRTGRAHVDTTRTHHRPNRPHYQIIQPLNLPLRRGTHKLNIQQIRASRRRPRDTQRLPGPSGNTVPGAETKEPLSVEERVVDGVESLLDACRGVGGEVKAQCCGSVGAERCRGFNVRVAVDSSPAPGDRIGRKGSLGPGRRGSSLSGWLLPPWWWCWL